MFCPKCRSEYRDEYTICNDCKIALVEEAPKKPAVQHNSLDFKILISLFDAGTIVLIKSVFDDANINYFMQGEDSMYLRPGIPVNLMVREDQVQTAQAILTELL